jgi:TIGR03009 family protein
LLFVPKCWILRGAKGDDAHRFSGLGAFFTPCYTPDPVKDPASAKYGGHPMHAWMLGIAILVIPAISYAQGTKGQTPVKGAPTSGKAAPSTPPKDSGQQQKNANAKTSDADMEKILRGWETKSRGVRDVECEFRRITRDTIFKTEEIEYGKASGIKPYQGRLDLLDANGKFTQIFIYTGKRLYQYDFKAKQESTYILPDPDPALGQSMPGPLGFVYGMTAVEAKARFDMKLVRQFSKGGIDYAEVHATPRTQADQQDFKTAKLLIDLRTYLPKELNFVEPNGNEQHWMFDRLETNLNPPVSSKDLEPFKNEELNSWKRVTNNLGEQPKQPADTPRTKAAPQSKSGPDASRPPAPKR